VDNDGNISYEDQPPPKGSKLLDAKEVNDKGSSNQNEGKLVIVYTVADCESCDLVLNKLEDANVRHEVKSLDDVDPQAVILAASGSLLAPTLMIGDNVITDISERNLQNELTAAGYDLSSAEPSANTAEQ